jgi:hypothetical protein
MNRNKFFEEITPKKTEGTKAREKQTNEEPESIKVNNNREKYKKAFNLLDSFSVDEGTKEAESVNSMKSSLEQGDIEPFKKHITKMIENNMSFIRGDVKELPGEGKPGERTAIAKNLTDILEELDNIKKISPKEKIEEITEENILESEELLEKIQTTDEQIQLFIRDINHGSKKTTEEIQGQIDLADSVLLELKSVENQKKDGLVKSLENRKAILLEKLNEQSKEDDKNKIKTVKEDINNSASTIKDQIANAQIGAENLVKVLGEKGFKTGKEEDKQEDNNFSIGSAHMKAEQIFVGVEEDKQRKENKEAETKNTFGELITRMRNNAGQYGEISENISEEIMDLNKEIDALDRKKILEAEDKERLQGLKTKREELVRKQKVSDGFLALSVSRIAFMKIVAGEEGDPLKMAITFRESFNIIKEGLQGEIDSKISKLPEPKKKIIETITEGEVKIAIKKGAETKSVTIGRPDRDPASFYKTESEKTRITKNVKIKREALETLRKNSLDLNDALTANTIIEIAEKCGKIIDKDQIKNINVENNRVIVNLLDNDKKSKLIIDLSKIDLYYKNTLAKKEAGWRKFIGGQKFGIAVTLEKEAIEINDQNPTIVDSEETLERFQEPEIAPINKTEIEETEWINTEDMVEEDQPQDGNSNMEPESIIETPTEIDTEKEVIGVAFGKPIFKKEENGSLGIGSKIAKAGKKFYGETFDKQDSGSEKETIGKISKDNAIKIENHFLEKDILRRFSVIWMNEHNLNQYSKENSVEKCLRAAAEENGGEGKNKNFLEFIQEAFKSDKANNEVLFVIPRFEELAGKPASDFTIGEVLAIIEEVRKEKR